jgi:hypothetical protein
VKISPFQFVKQPCDDTLQWAKKQLSQANLCAVQTFDLHTVRAGLHDCPCPHHGTEDCDCQMVVVLVYGKAMDPATLILHGSDGQTWLSLVNNSNQPTDESIRSTIERALQLDPAE